MTALQGWSQVAPSFFRRDGYSQFPAGIAVRETFEDTRLSVKSLAQISADRMFGKVTNLRIIREGLISRAEPVAYGMELQFTADISGGPVQIRRDHLWTLAHVVGGGRNYVLEVIFSCLQSEYDRIKPEFLEFLEAMNET